MRKRGARRINSGASNVGVHSLIAIGIARAERQRRANVIARPMREVMDMLAQGEVFEIDGQAFMKMPEVDPQFAEQSEWCAISPAIDGWIDCWSRLAPDINTYHLGVLAERLASDKPITQRLVELARDEFDATVRRIVDLPDGAIKGAVRTTQIAWEMEKLGGMSNNQGNGPA